MGKLAAEKFRELTDGSPVLDAASSVFDFIRDIPYRVDPRQFHLDEGPEEMIRSNRGSCFPKHYLLGSMLGALGFEVRYSVYVFYWKDQCQNMPEEVLCRAGKIPATYHLALRIVSDREQAIVDATWDKALLKAGFPVNESWDPRGGTRLAVLPEEEIRADTAFSAAKIVRDRFDRYTLGERLELSRFTIEFNRWMENLYKGEAK